MRVLYFSERLTVHDQRFLAAYAARGHETYFLRLLPDEADFDERPLPVGVVPLAWKRRPFEDPGTFLDPKPIDRRKWAAALSATIAPVAPDLVHAGPLTTCAWLAASVPAERLLVMSWASDVIGPTGSRPEVAARAREALAAADHVQCDADAVRERLLAYGARPETIVQFPWGIDVDMFSPGASGWALRRRLGWEAATVVVSPRQWEPIYGIDVALSAFRHAVRKRPDLRLALVGDGSLRCSVEAMVRELGLGDLTVMPGRLQNHELVEYLRGSDIYLSTSHSDGTSISLLETLAVGPVPVLTDLPGNREWVADGVNGWLAPDGRPHAFATAILETAEDPGRRASMAEANRGLVVERARWDENVAGLLDLVEKVAL